MTAFPRLRYDSKPKFSEVKNLMKIRWKFVAVIALLVFGIAAFVNRKTVTAAPQSAAPAKVEKASNSSRPAHSRSPTPRSRSTHPRPCRSGSSTTRLMRSMTLPSTPSTPTRSSPITTSPARRSTTSLPISTRTRLAQRHLGARGQDRGKPRHHLRQVGSEEYGSEEIKSIEVVGQGDLTKDLQYIAPDDGNKDDKTVIDLKLAKPIPPNSFVQFKITFHDQMPETQARSGWKRDFLLGGQWFPKVGVWWHGAWNCHQYHATTEFFADFGVYDVKLTVPQNEVIGASGVQVSDVNNPDGTKTVAYHGDDIHDFAWTVSPRYKVKESTYQAQMGPVQLRFLMQPAHWDQMDRHGALPAKVSITSNNGTDRIPTNP